LDENTNNTVRGGVHMRTHIIHLNQFLLTKSS
jgi:hypothetical protein